MVLGIGSIGRRSLQPRPFGLETDFQPRPGRLGVFFKGPGRGHASAAFHAIKLYYCIFAMSQRGQRLPD